MATLLILSVRTVFHYDLKQNLQVILYLDLAAGSSCDYAYDTEGVVYSYALELRDTGRYGKIDDTISNNLG